MSRKDEHVTYALEQFEKRIENDFDQMKLIHHSLKGIDVIDIDISTTIGSIDLETPFFINAMTGGSEWTKEINAKLAWVARQTGLAMATGSMSVALKDEKTLDSFTVVREINPEGIVFANLNLNYPMEEMKKAMDLLRADALQIHLNAAQEIVMPEGDRHFSHWPQMISTVTRNIKKDIIVKEVGFGMSQETIAQLIESNVKIIDVSGRGGTNFASIENNRRKSHKMSYMTNWGQSTIQSLIEATVYKNDVDIIASGGIRHPLDMIKAFVLGAKAVGISGTILNMVMSNGVENTVEMIESWKEELKLLMALVGAQNILQLRKCDYILSNDLTNYINNRKRTKL